MNNKKRYTILIVILIVAASIAWFLTQCLVWENPRYTELKALSGKWETTLSNHLANADTLVILDRPNTVLLTITDTNDIQKLIVAIKVDEKESNGMCMCGGNPWFIFKQGTNVLASISLKHDKALWWDDGMWGMNEAVLTSNSIIKFLSWMSDHKINIANQGMEPTSANAQSIVPED